MYSTLKIQRNTSFTWKRTLLIWFKYHVHVKRSTKQFHHRIDISYVSCYARLFTWCILLNISRRCLRSREQLICHRNCMLCLLSTQVHVFASCFHGNYLSLHGNYLSLLFAICFSFNFFNVGLHSILCFVNNRYQFEVLRFDRFWFCLHIRQINFGPLRRRVWFVLLSLFLFVFSPFVFVLPSSVLSLLSFLFTLAIPPSFPSLSFVPL